MQNIGLHLKRTHPLEDNMEDGLSIDDLTNVLRVINTAQQRGAVKANELSFVGGVYDKFATFIRLAQSEANESEPIENGESSEDGSE